MIREHLNKTANRIIPDDEYQSLIDNTPEELKKSNISVFSILEQQLNANRKV